MWERGAWGRQGLLGWAWMWIERGVNGRAHVELLVCCCLLLKILCHRNRGGEVTATTTSPQGGAVAPNPSLLPEEDANTLHVQMNINRRITHDVFIGWLGQKQQRRGLHMCFCPSSTCNYPWDDAAVMGPTQSPNFSEAFYKCFKQSLENSLQMARPARFHAQLVLAALAASTLLCSVVSVVNTEEIDLTSGRQFVDLMRALPSHLNLTLRIPAAEPPLNINALEGLPLIPLQGQGAKSGVLTIAGPSPPSSQPVLFLGHLRNVSVSMGWLSTSFSGGMLWVHGQQENG